MQDGANQISMAIKYFFFFFFVNTKGQKTHKSSRN